MRIMPRLKCWISITAALLVACWTWSASPLSGATKSLQASKTEQEKAAAAPSPEAAQPAHSAAGSENESAQPVHAPAASEKAGHADAHAGHHEDFDLSHQNVAPKLDDPSEWKRDLALATLVVFLLLLLVLSKFAWGPLMEGLERRERAIAENIEQARLSAERAALQLRQYEAKLAAATEEAREILNQARKDADAARERILVDAQEAARRERQRAIEDIHAAKNVALQEMTQKSVDLAVAMAGRLVRRQLKREDHAQLIREALDQFPSKN